MVLLYPFFFAFLSREKWYPLSFLLMRLWAKWIVYSAFIVPSVRKEIPPHLLPCPCIFVSNHVSYLDIVLSYVIIRKYFVFIGKQELDKAPLFRIFFRDMNILVDRKSTMGSHKAFVKAADKVSKGQNMFIFPEATINAWGKLMPFKNGAFKLAIDKQIPVVPVTYLNNWRLLQNGGFLKAHGRPGIARIMIHAPIETKGMSEDDLISLRNKVHGIIARALKEFNTNEN
jgi:1-acyl-sn-glycerol-3-phosphate acyltransferase